MNDGNELEQIRMRKIRALLDAAAKPQQPVNKEPINLISAYMSCPADTSVDHKGFFTIDAKNPEVIKKFFGAMTVEVRPVKPLSEVAKTL